jgi:hypothetical protein
MNRTINIRLLALLSSMSLGALALTGCTTGYHTYPVIESAEGASTNPNLPTNVEAQIRALQWVVNKYPIEVPRAITRNDIDGGGKPFSSGTIAINLVPGSDQDTYRRACKTLSESLGVEAIPLTSAVLEHPTVPVYVVGRVWVRTQTAKVDIFRPMYDLPRKSDGTPVYQCITVNLRGWLEPWAVDNIQVREPGAIETPAYTPLDKYSAKPTRTAIISDY